MTGVFGEKVSLAQANGPDVDLVVRGDEWYATYETVAGYAAIYDEIKGLFCYARVVDGHYQSSGIPIAEDPPAGISPHERESEPVRAAKVAERERQRRQRAAPSRKGE